MNAINITDTVWEYLRSQDTKIAARVLNKLNYDICYFYTDGRSMWIEKTYSSATIPDYLYYYVNKHEEPILKLWREKRDEQ